MIALIYNRAGRIVQSIQSSEEIVDLTARAMGCSYLEYVLNGDRPYDQAEIDSFTATHEVVDGNLVEITE